MAERTKIFGPCVIDDVVVIVRGICGTDVRRGTANERDDCSRRRRLHHRLIATRIGYRLGIGDFNAHGIRCR